MSDVEDLGKRFREATTDLPIESVRWDRVARIVRRRALLMLLAVVVLSVAIIVVVSSGLLVGKAAVDPSFRVPFTSHAELSVKFGEPHAARGQVRLRDFLSSHHRPASGTPQRALDAQGFVFSIRTRLVGYRGATAKVDWSVLDATSRRTVAVDTRSASPAVRPRSADETIPFDVWVPYPARSGKFIVRFRLSRADGQLITQRDSAPFVALRSDYFRRYRTPTYIAKLPRDWTIIKDYRPTSGRFVSLATAPGHVSVLIDTTLGFVGNSAKSARTLERGYRSFSGYRRLVFQQETLGTGPAFEWSYAFDGKWTTDIFFVRDGDGYAVLATGPEARYSETRAVARSIARSLRGRD
jgi:hypothetical protein